MNLGRGNYQIILKVILAKFKALGSDLDYVRLVRVQVVRDLIDQIQKRDPLRIVKHDDLAALLDEFLVYEWNYLRILQIVPIRVLDAFVRKKYLLLAREEHVIFTASSRQRIFQILDEVLIDLYLAERLDVESEHLKLLLLNNIVALVLCVIDHLR